MLRLYAVIECSAILDDRRWGASDGLAIAGAWGADTELGPIQE